MSNESRYIVTGCGVCMEDTKHYKDTTETLDGRWLPVYICEKCGQIRDAKLVDLIMARNKAT